MKTVLPLVVAASLCLAPAALAGTAPRVDGHTHQGLAVEGGELRVAGIERVREMGFQALLVGLPIERSKTSDPLGRLVREREALASLAERDAGLYFVERPASLLDAEPPAGIGVLLAVEWFGPLFEGDASRAVRLRELGIRVVSLVDADPDGLFGEGGVADRVTPFGREVVAALEGAGILVDLTHLRPARQLAVLAAAREPVVVSHGNSLGIAAEPGNLPDEVLAALAANRGQVWVSFNRNGVFAKGEDDGAAVERLVDHLLALADRLGPAAVGLGTDLQADGRYVPDALYRPDTLERVAAELRARGVGEAEIDGFLGGNVLRALAAAADRRPSVE